MIKEIVPVHSSKLENRAFFIGVMSVISIASLLLLLTRNPATTTVKLPKAFSNIAIQLANAGSEIALMQELEIVGDTVTLEALTAQGITPFLSGDRFLEADNCFVFMEGNVQIRLIKKPEHDWQVEWLQDDHAHDTQAQNDLNTAAHFCQHGSNWKPVTGDPH